MERLVVGEQGRLEQGDGQGDKLPVKMRLDFGKQLNEEAINDDECTLSGSDLDVAMLTLPTTLMDKKAVPQVDEVLQAEVIHAPEPNEEEATPVRRATKAEELNKRNIQNFVFERAPEAMSRHLRLLFITVHMFGVPVLKVMVDNGATTCEGIVYTLYGPECGLSSGPASLAFGSRGLGSSTFPWGRVTDTREKESPLIILRPEVQNVVLSLEIRGKSRGSVRESGDSVERLEGCSGAKDARFGKDGHAAGGELRMYCSPESTSFTRNDGIDLKS
ncbi:hypothetical protein CRG98_027021 [Punica granatum]|uniref:Uncharacterized protein n=1 Tax=Punica granatum TaxID=22663 RepID=A0A2I0J997_PUNGR|nr:hypothetical protein CRG98_027021 [Punica granatum]